MGSPFWFPGGGPMAKGNAIELASAYVSISTDTSKVAPEIKKSLGAVESSVASRGKGIGGGLMKGIGGGLLGGAAVVGAAAGASLGVALTKGFNRLAAIDVAEKKLTGLGHSAEAVSTIMSNASASVKGTAFGLGDAAGVAAQMVAAGVKPGERLQGVLTAVSNSAAAAGSDLGEMGAIWSKAATQANGIQNDVLSQIADRGIPIYQALGDQMGVTAGEVFKLASDGKVSFEMFEKAATAAAGTVASEMGNTVGGAMDNLGASMGRIGAGLLGGVYDEIAPSVQAITTALGPLEAVAASAGESIGEFLAPAFEWFRDLLDSGFDFSQFAELAGYLSPLGLIFKALEPVLPEVGAALADVAGVLAGALGGVLSEILPVLGDLAVLLAETLADALPVLMPFLTMLAGVVGEVLVAVMPLVASLLTGLMPVFQQLLEAITPILEPLLSLIEPLMDMVMVVLPPLIDLLAWLVSVALTGLSWALDALLPIIEGIAEAIATNLSPLIEALTGHFENLSNFLTGVFTGDWEKAWGAVEDIFESVWSNLVSIGMGSVNSIIDLINGLVGAINSVMQTLSGLTGGSFSVQIPELSHFSEKDLQPNVVSSVLANVRSGPNGELYNTPLAPTYAGAGEQAQIFNFNAAPGMSEEAAGKAAAREWSTFTRDGW